MTKPKVKVGRKPCPERVEARKYVKSGDLRKVLRTTCLSAGAQARVEIATKFGLGMRVDQKVSKKVITKTP